MYLDKAYECGFCHKRFRTEAEANACCICEMCSKEGLLCSGTREGKKVCSDCKDKWDIDHATKVPDDGKPVFSVNGRYYCDLEHAWDDGPGEYVFASKPVYFQLDFDLILEHEIEHFGNQCDIEYAEAIEESIRSLPGLEELRAAADKFNESARRHPITYEIDKTRKIWVPPVCPVCQCFDCEHQT
jgi:hypothetical protein